MAKTQEPFGEEITVEYEDGTTGSFHYPTEAEIANVEAEFQAFWSVFGQSIEDTMK